SAPLCSLDSPEHHWLESARLPEAAREERRSCARDSFSQKATFHHKGGVMNTIVSRALVVAGSVLMLGGRPSWGQPPNNDPSGTPRNTAGGTGALENNVTGTDNTA